MKKSSLLYTICSIIFMIGFTACDENNDGYYDNIPRIYFGADSLNYSFGDQLAEYTSHTFYYPIKMEGMKATKELKYKVIVNEELSTAQKDVHYIALKNEYTLLIDSVNAWLPIELIREHMPETDTSFKIVFHLVPNEDFQEGIIEHQTAVLTFNNFLEEPSWWQSNFNSASYGPYQPGKYQRLIAFFGSPEKVAEASYLELSYAYKTQVYDYGMAHPEAGFILKDPGFWPFE